MSSKPAHSETAPRADAPASGPSGTAPANFALDQKKIDAARHSLDDGAVTPSIKPYAEQICEMLNQSLATEWVCVLRYRRHHFTAKGLASPKIAEEFLVHANAELGHADRIAERIVQLGGEPAFDPDTLTQLAHASYDDSSDLKSMIRANLLAERVAVEIYRQMIEVIRPYDPTTSNMLQSILRDEEEHADELADWLES